MKVTVIPASSKVCRAAIATLLAHPNGPQVIGVYRDTNKAPAEFTQHAKFHAIRGDVTDAATLDFSATDIVLALTPPKYDGGDILKYATTVGTNIRSAIERAGTVRRVVYVSSVGAQFASGVGEIKSNHASEEIYRDAAPEVVFVRNAYYMENWGMALETIQGEKPHFASPISPAEFKIPMVSTRDIGVTCAAQILDPGASVQPGLTTFELRGPQEYSANDVLRAFETLTGKNIELKVLEREELSAFFGGFLPPDVVGDFVEMTEAILPGGVIDVDSRGGQKVVRGRDTLVDTFRGMLKG